MFFKDFCVFVLWANVASALEGLDYAPLCSGLYNLLNGLWLVIDGTKDPQFTLTGILSINFLA